jgi:formate hydrogenlyase subunit 6/NADH:ubiquinone oxidoreductase subunit I
MAISGEKKKLHTIDQEKCIACGLCRDACKFEAVIVS